MSKYSPVYYHCPRCGAINMKKRGTPKKRFYECKKCGYIQSHLAPRFRGRKK